MKQGVDEIRMRLLTYAIVGSVLLALAATGTLLYFTLRSKAKYEESRLETNRNCYPVVRMDNSMTAFLADVERSWTRKSEEKNGPSADMCRLAGMKPTVQAFLEIQCYQMPPFNWLSPSENKRAAELGVIKLNLFMESKDRQWHVSEDGHLSFLRHSRGKPEAVFVLRDEADGLHVVMYKNENQK